MAINATCKNPRCVGNVELTREQVRLAYDPLEDNHILKFDCPVCGVETSVFPALHIVQQLKASGIKSTVINMPFHISRDGEDQPLTEEEVEEMIHQLAHIDIIAKLTEGGLL